MRVQHLLLLEILPPLFLLPLAVLYLQSMLPLVLLFHLKFFALHHEPLLMFLFKPRLLHLSKLAVDLLWCIALLHYFIIKISTLLFDLRGLQIDIPVGRVIGCATSEHRALLLALDRTLFLGLKLFLLISFLTFGHVDWGTSQK